MNDTQPMHTLLKTDSQDFFDCSIRHSAVKRCFDLLFSLIVFILLSPLIAVISVLILVNSGGRLIYAHERIGRGGKSFRCYKFRTMYEDADKRLADILNSDPALKEEWEKNFKLKNDPRITPIGRFLRKTSLDELPQFLNVLKGDLSIVGPRPVVMEELKKYYGPKAGKILSVRPGITGLWQVSGRSDTSYAKRLQLDEKYIDHQSFLNDIKLILKTLPVVILSRGAY